MKYKIQTITPDGIEDRLIIHLYATTPEKASEMIMEIKDLLAPVEEPKECEACKYAKVTDSLTHTCEEPTPDPIEECDHEFVMEDYELECQLCGSKSTPELKELQLLSESHANFYSTGELVLQINKLSTAYNTLIKLIQPTN